MIKHPRGYWCQKVQGKLHDFGKIAWLFATADDQADDHQDEQVPAANDRARLRVVSAG